MKDITKISKNVVSLFMLTIVGMVSLTGLAAIVYDMPPADIGTASSTVGNWSLERSTTTAPVLRSDFTPMIAEGSKWVTAAGGYYPQYTNDSYMRVSGSQGWNTQNVGAWIFTAPLTGNYSIETTLQMWSLYGFDPTYGQMKVSLVTDNTSAMTTLWESGYQYFSGMQYYSYDYDLSAVSALEGIFMEAGDCLIFSTQGQINPGYAIFATRFTEIGNTPNVVGGSILYEVPEPATMAILGLGSILALGKKRK